MIKREFKGKYTIIFDKVSAEKKKEKRGRKRKKTELFKKNKKEMFLAKGVWFIVCRDQRLSTFPTNS